MEKQDCFAFKNYKILSLIGEGSFGKVFKASENATQNIVALKILLKRGRSTKELSALKQEANIQQNLRHPNIIQLFTSFETDNELVFVCEYAVSDLHKLLAKLGSLGEQRTQKLSYDLISALYYLHSHRILHRDLKVRRLNFIGLSFIIMKFFINSHLIYCLINTIKQRYVTLGSQDPYWEHKF